MKKLITATGLALALGLVLTGCVSTPNSNENPSPNNTNPNGNPDGYNISLEVTPAGDAATFSLDSIPDGFTIEEDAPQKDNTEGESSPTENFVNLYANGADGCVIQISITYLPSKDSGKGDLFSTKNYLYQSSLEYTTSDERSIGVKNDKGDTVEFRAMNIVVPNVVYGPDPNVEPVTDGDINYIVAARTVDRVVDNGYPVPEGADPASIDTKGLATYIVSYSCVNAPADQQVFDDFLSHLTINGLSKP